MTNLEPCPYFVVQREMTYRHWATDRWDSTTFRNNLATLATRALILLSCAGASVFSIAARLANPSPSTQGFRYLLPWSFHLRQQFTLGRCPRGGQRSFERLDQSKVRDQSNHYSEVGLYSI